MYMFGDLTLHVIYVALHIIYDTLRVTGACVSSSIDTYDTLHTIYDTLRIIGV